MQRFPRPAITPIAPDEVQSVKNNQIPAGIIEVFNNLIVEQWNVTSALIKQNQVITRIQATMEYARQTIFDNHWLNIEDIFRKAGWNVEYDKPGYNESYEASWKFTKNTKGF